jgi:hypothetical protein
VNAIEWITWLGKLTGLTPNLEFSETGALPSCITDNACARDLGLTWNVDWKSGMRRMIQARYPEIRLQEPADA